MRRNTIEMCATSAVFLALILALCSCVKERREDCPCWLTVYVKGCEPLSRDVTVSASTPRRLFREKIDTRDYPEGYERTVPRGMVNLSAYAGAAHMSEHHDTLRIRTGLQCDSLFSHHSEVDCRGEEAQDSVKLHKQFSTVFLKMGCQENIPYPYRLVVRGRVDGIRLTDAEPTLGPFEYEPVAVAGGEFRFRIPRQADNSLLLDVYDGALLLTTLALGEAIGRQMELQGTFTWNSLDLGDIYISIDYSLTAVSVSVNGWTPGESHQVII